MAASRALNQRHPFTYTNRYVMNAGPLHCLGKLARSFLSILVISPFSTIGAPPDGSHHPLATAINGIGLDLYRSLAANPDGNLVLSPYSIELALAMACSGADGKTASEMRCVLRLRENGDVPAEQFGGFAKELAALATESKKRIEATASFRGDSTPVEISTANRLFVQDGFDLRKPFTHQLADPSRFNAPLESLDFRGQPEKARGLVNRWVEQQTRNKIKNLVPRGSVSTETRVVLANAIYFRAAWAMAFLERSTTPEEFFVNGKTAAKVPTMKRKGHLGYAKIRDFTAAAIPFTERDLSFLILLPDAKDGLPKLEKEITPETFEEVTRALAMTDTKYRSRDVELHLPKFRIEPPTVPLSAALQKLGMKTAFDQPKGSANFDRITPRRPDDYLFIGEVFHKAFIALDEKGVEAAAATAVMALAGSAAPVEKPPVVRVDRPFLFAIQFRGTCLFLGRVTDPRN